MIDLVLEIIEKLGGGKRSGKEWEGMARGLKYLLYWAEIQLKSSKISEDDILEDQENISNLSRLNIVQKCVDIIHEEIGKCMSVQFGPDSKTLKTGPVIILIAPPGFVPFSELQKLCSRKNWDLSYKLSQRKNLRPMLRLVSPSLCSIKAKHIKPHSYIVRLDVTSPNMEKNVDEIIHSISNAFNNFKEPQDNVVYQKYLNSIFSNVFQYPKIKTKVLYELRKQQKMKPIKEVRTLQNYDLWIEGGESQLSGVGISQPSDSQHNLAPKRILRGNSRCYNFNFATLENLMNQILQEHKTKVLNCKDDTFDFLSDNQAEMDKKLKKHRKKKREEKKELVIRLSQQSSSSS